MISTYLVNGFLDAGKSTYIEDCFKNDFFYKREKGKTLLICFEEGEKEFDLDFLHSRKTDVIYYDHIKEIRPFIQQAIDLYSPDRIYIEMNNMIENLYSSLPDVLRIDFSITLIDGSTLSLYYNNMRQFLQNMITISHHVIFNRCKKEIVEPYGNIFKVMNPKAMYLWEGDTGYHEKAFGVLLPYDLNQEKIIINDSDYVPFYLDSLEAPDHYVNKTIELIVQVLDDQKVGRQVMTCCLADIQYLSFISDNLNSPKNTWIHLKAKGKISYDIYHQKRLALEMIKVTDTKIPEHRIIGL